MRRLMPLAIVTLFALTLGAPPVTAVADRTPVTAVIVGAEDLAPGEPRETGNALKGTIELWGAQGRQWWDGDAYLHGTAVVTYNFVSAWVCDEALSCKVTGRLWGTTTWEPYAFDGGWEGTFTVQITSFDEYGFSYSGKLQAKGYGELEGRRLMLDVAADATVPPWEGSHTVTGYVLTHGK